MDKSCWRFLFSPYSPAAQRGRRLGFWSQLCHFLGVGGWVNISGPQCCHLKIRTWYQMIAKVFSDSEALCSKGSEALCSKGSRAVKSLCTSTNRRTCPPLMPLTWGSYSSVDSWSKSMMLCMAPLCVFVYMSPEVTEKQPSFLSFSLNSCEFRHACPCSTQWWPSCGTFIILPNGPFLNEGKGSKAAETDKNS